MNLRNTAPRTAAIEAALLRGIAAAAGLDAADRQKPLLIVEELRTHDWASATFEGARHEFDLRLDGSAQAVQAAWALLAASLREWNFTMRGHIVADIDLARPTAAPRPEVTSDVAGQETAEALMPGPSTVSQPFTVNILTIID